VVSAVDSKTTDRSAAAERLSGGETVKASSNPAAGPAHGDLIIRKDTAEKKTFTVVEAKGKPTLSREVKKPRETL